MKTIRFALGSLLFLAFFAGVTQAQVQRTFVSRLGSDGNPCSFTAPCRTFGTAIGQTNAGGEVIVLDSAGYGAFSINKAVSIIAPQGVYAGISVFSGDGIGINAGSGDTVILRGLTVNSQGGDSGIVFNTGGTLHIENCVVSGFTNLATAGIWFQTAGSLFVKDTTARGNHIGIRIEGGGHASMEQVRLDGNFEGLAVIGGMAAIRNSSISGNTYGAAVESAGSVALLDIDTCLITNNVVGIFTASGNSFMSISNCTISHNSGAGFNISGGGILSRGNNTIIGNGANSGALTPLTAQ